MMYLGNLQIIDIIKNKYIHVFKYFKKQFITYLLLKNLIFYCLIENDITILYWLSQ